MKRLLKNSWQQNKGKKKKRIVVLKGEVRRTTMVTCQ
jgi:hypothetical protein